MRGWRMRRVSGGPNDTRKNSACCKGDARLEQLCNVLPHQSTFREIGTPRVGRCGILQIDAPIQHMSLAEAPFKIQNPLPMHSVAACLFETTPNSKVSLRARKGGQDMNARCGKTVSAIPVPNTT